MSRRSYRHVHTACLPWVLLLSTAGQAQEIVSEHWGFDGRVVPNRFNILTVHVRNPTDKPIDKQLQLSKTQGLSDVGAPLVQRCYLGPGASRWLQFTPYISSPTKSWALSWVEGGAAGSRLGAPTTGVGATILLEVEPIEKTRRLRVRAFPPVFLPTSATAMDGLRAVVMDRMPELTTPQRLALLDWVRRGGEIHLLQRVGLPAVLTEEFEVLSSDEDLIAFGNGRVYRHAFDRFALRTELPKELFGGSKFLPGVRMLTSVDKKLRRSVLKPDEDLNYGWGLIFLLTVVYLITIGPVFYRLSTHRLSWPVSLLTLVAIVGVSTWLFNVVGERGGETATSKSWSYVRPAGNDYEVTRFVNVFVTSEGEYEFSDGDNYGLYSSAQSLESIVGRIHNRTKGNYTVEMPRFSSRLIINKSRVSGPKHGASFDGTFHAALPFRQVLCINGREKTEYTPSGTGVWIPRQTRSLTSFLRNYQADFTTMALDDVVIDRLWLKSIDPKHPATHDNHYVFFCSGPTPAEFHVTGKGPGVGIGREDGTTVYRFDFLYKQ